jgi:hypothetical protein
MHSIHTHSDQFTFPMQGSPPPLNCHNKAMRSSYGVWKTEVLHTEPEVYLFHDVIDEREINHVKSMTQSQVGFRRLI